MLTVFFVGTAGSGKSTLVSSYLDWLEGNGFDVAVVNMDPAADYIPYVPDVDIRDRVSAKKLMREYKLGPNASIIASIDMAILEAERIKEEIEATGAPYVLIDTPGQMELFAFRETGRYLVNKLSGDKNAVVFIIDITYAQSPTGLASSLLLALSVNVRLAKPQITVLNKVDLVPEDVVENVIQWVEHPEQLERMLEASGATDYLLAEKLVELISSLWSVSPPIALSAKTGQGMDVLYTALQQVYVGGEDYQEPP